MKIGLLGGSFNPAHAGHLHISLQAIKHLQLDKIWWLVSPQNPLKSSADMAEYGQRIASAKKQITNYSNISICEIEQENNLQYSADTIELLIKQYPQNKFIWLMGSDNLAQFNKWHKWRYIMHNIAICVMDRSPHSHGALRSPAALGYAKYRISQDRSAQLADATLPAWSYLFIPRHRQSATNLRNKFGKNAFL